MPFIRGRYHINAIAGEALEAAREAEAALQALEHEAAQAGRMMKATTARGNRRRVRTKDLFIASKSKRQNWCRLIRDERSAVSSRAFTGRRFSLTKAGTDSCRAQQAETPSGPVRRNEHDSRHCDHHEQGRCRRRGTPHVRRHMCSPTIMIWSASCEMSLRNLADAVSEDEGAEPPRFSLVPFSGSKAEVRAGARAGLE
jgi:hypothetical protein